MISTSQRGFTLIELMVVTAIIGLLSQRAMVNVMPALYKGKRAGLTLYMSGNVRLAMAMFGLDKAHYPTVAEIGPTQDPTQFLVTQKYLERDLTQLSGELKESLSSYYVTDGKTYAYTVCFSGIGAHYLEEPCFRMNEASAEYTTPPAVTP